MDNSKDNLYDEFKKKKKKEFLFISNRQRHRWYQMVGICVGPEA